MRRGVQVQLRGFAPEADNEAEDETDDNWNWDNESAPKLEGHGIFTAAMYDQKRPWKQDNKRQ